MPIPEDIVELVRSQADIVEIIGEFVPLRRRGRSYVALCPFHKERTPSFSVSPERGIFKCFGCGKGGNVFTFLMEYHGISFTEAVRMVAHRIGIDIPEQQAQDAPIRSEKEQLYRVLQAATDFFVQQLHSPAGQKARLYLERRGIRKQIIEQFQLGYAPAGWDALQNTLRQQGFSPELLVKAGLVVETEKSVYDRFRHRLIFPIFHSFGQVVGFGARRLREEDTPKYLNSPQTMVYDKSQVLYGLYQARDAIRREQKAIVVEGYMDVLALVQAGIANVVATCGTALTAQHLRTLKRYAPAIALLYDQDEAGQQAAARAVELAFATGIDVFVVQLPEGEDPDSFVRRFSVEELRRRVDEAMDGLAFLLHHLHQQGRMATPVQQAQAVKYLVEVIAQISDPLQQDFAIRQLAQHLRFPEARLYQTLQQLRRKRRLPTASAAAPSSTQPEQTPSADESTGLLPEEETIFRILLRHPESIASAIERQIVKEELFISGAARTLFQVLHRRAQPDGEWIHGILQDEAIPESIRMLLAGLLVDPETPSDRWRAYEVQIEVDERAAFRDSIRRLQLRQLQQRQEQLKQQLAGADDAEMVQLLQQLQQLQEQIAALQQSE